MPKHPWIPNSPDEIKKEMLKKIGVDSVEELFSDIPRGIRVKNWDELEIGFGDMLSEIDVRRRIDEILDKNIVFKNPPPFLGGGAWPHYVPPLVKYIMSRSEFLTTYTPYQPEIVQGLMQALFEYQSLMAELLEMDVVNASMYDWASALGEAVLMAARISKGRRKVLVPYTMNPIHYSVLKTYVYPRDIVVEKVGYDRETGIIDLEDLKNKIDNETLAVYIENPSFLGTIEVNAKDIGEIVHDKNAIYIMGVDPISLGLLEAPGKLGADIVVGDGQPLGLGLNYGGPYLGIFATRDDIKFIRQMPGRIIGLTTTIDGRERAFAMILQTREQHIRRERATSNICTNETLCAIGVAVYIALLGREGFRKIGELIYYRSHYAAKKINEITGVKAPKFKGEFFKEFVIDFNDTGIEYTEIHRRLLDKGVHGGLYLRKWFPEFGESALYCVTELHTKRDIDLLVSLLKNIVERS